MAVQQCWIRKPGREILPYGGFFTDLTVEIFRNGQWQAVTGLAFSEDLDPNAYYQTIEMAFDPIAGSAMRIRGNAGGSQQFTTIVELDAYGAMGIAGTLVAPEPGSVMLLMFGAAALAGRRRGRRRERLE